MSSQKNIFVTSLSFILALSLVLPFQAVRADEDTASSTPAVEVVETPTPEIVATSTDPVIIDTATTTEDVATSTEDTTPGPVVSTFSLTAPVSTNTPDSITINLEVASATTTLFSAPITVTTCNDSSGIPTITINGYCALNESGLNVIWNTSYGDPFLDSINGASNDYTNGLYWGWFSNLEYGQTALNQHVLAPGEDLLVSLRNPLKLVVASTSPMVNATTTVTVYELGFDSSYNAVWLPAASSTVNADNQTLTTGGDGTAVLSIATSSPFTVSATLDGFLPAKAVTITPITPAAIPSPISINLEIDSATTTLFAGTVTVTACSATPSGTPTVSGYCAINQSGVNVVWDTSYGDPFLDTINGAGNDYMNNMYWGWFSNLDYGQTALSQHLLASDEKLLITLRNPLKITIGTTSPVVGATTTVSVFEFGFDSSYAPLWSPAASSTITAGDQILTTGTDGTAILTIATSSPFTISATLDGFLPTTLTVTPGTSNTPSGTTNNGSGGSGNTTVSAPNVASAFGYLVSQQQNDGSINIPEKSDWAALAFALNDAPAGARSKLTSFLQTSRPSLDIATDYERHAMALMALGINPYSGAGVDYIAPIISKFDGTQIGFADRDSDDIFGLLVLSQVGYTSNDTIIQKSVASLVRAQHSDGSWTGGIDMTAAGIQALSPFTSLPGVSAALTKAEGLLRANQQADGGFGNSDSTSWILGAIAARGESVSSWSVNGKTPLDSLSALQQTDGGINPTNLDVGARVWSTEFALPAFEGRSWASLMQTFPKSTSSTEGGSTTSSTTSSTATSTTATYTTSTSTPVVIPASVTVDTPVYPTPHTSSLKALSPAQEVSTSTNDATSSVLAAAAGSSEGAHSLWSSVMSFFAWIASLFGKIF